MALVGAGEEIVLTVCLSAPFLDKMTIHQRHRLDDILILWLHEYSLVEILPAIPANAP